MSDLFAAYAQRANTITTQPAALLGPLRRRADARTRYAEIVAAMTASGSSEALEAYLASISKEVTQFAAELEFLWLGDDVFRGLKKEIEWARARFDAGLDFPRWEEG